MFFAIIFEVKFSLNMGSEVFDDIKWVECDDFDKDRFIELIQQDWYYNHEQADVDVRIINTTPFTSKKKLLRYMSEVIDEIRLDWKRPLHGEDWEYYHNLSPDNWVY
ncbi:hypothetical protein [Spirosoma areae]